MKFEDGTDHCLCPECGLCIDCGDCDKLGCGAEMNEEAK